MSTATHKAIVRRYYEQVFNERRHDLVDEFLAENITLHGTGLPPGLEAVKQWLAAFSAAFPDLHQTIEDMVAEEDRVVARTTVTGTHRGELQGIPATGKPITQPAITLFRLANGRIAESWLVADNLGLMQQLGVIPAPQGG